MSTVRIAPERVLPTLNADGTRRLIRPKLSPGPLYEARKWVAWGLMVLFIAVPFLRWNGKPLMLLDLPRRQFTLFGETFLPTDTVLLMLLLLSIFLGIFWITALVGRGWCGWACPQTVYMEFLFRPIERLIEGSRSEQLKRDARGGFSVRRAAKVLVFAIVSVVLGNVFLAYFVGTEQLGQWIQRSPLDHPEPFLVMAVTAALVLLDFAYFREQMCTVACPYARLQSVLLDKRSLVIGYDARRGEPRAKGKPRAGVGDCVDCNACVATCPTGIDIRDGLQLECISCGQCVDACNLVMTRIKKPLGLIRYTSQESLETGKRHPLLRTRVIVYPVLIVGLLIALGVQLRGRTGADITVLRGIGAPYVVQGDQVRNQIRIKIGNRSSDDRKYRIELAEKLPGAVLIAPQNPLHVAAFEQQTTTAFVIAPASLFELGQRAVSFKISDGHGFEQRVQYKLIGPMRSHALHGGS